MATESKNKIEPVASYVLKDGRRFFVVNKTGREIGVFFTQTDESATLEIRRLGAW